MDKEEKRKDSNLPQASIVLEDIVTTEVAQVKGRRVWRRHRRKSKLEKSVYERLVEVQIRVQCGFHVL